MARRFKQIPTGQGRSNRKNASSALASVEWQPDNDYVDQAMGSEELGTLIIEFASGGVYEYTEVPKRVYESMLKSPSMGRYFNAMVRNAFSYDQVG